MSFDSKVQEMVDALERIADNLPENASSEISFDTEAYNAISYIGEYTHECANQQELIYLQLKKINENFENLNSILMQLVVDKSQ